jgi:hypothetical protein
MGIYQVQIWGDGFFRQGKKCSFELGGIIEASTVEEAFARAVNLAKRAHPDLAQADHAPSQGGAVINVDEIEEFPNAPKSTIGKIELHWN